MKKTFMMVGATLMVAFSALAVTPEELASSKDRIAKLTEMKAVEKTGLSNVDAFSDKAATVQKNTIDISKILNKYYALSMGQVPEGCEEGEAAPSLEECQALYKRIEEQTKEIGNSANMAVKAADDIKNAKMMVKPKGTKSLGESKKIFTTAGEETAFQTKLITETISNLTK